jgi:hypothetical protein
MDKTIDFLLEQFLKGPTDMFGGVTGGSSKPKKAIPISKVRFGSGSEDKSQGSFFDMPATTSPVKIKPIVSADKKVVSKPKEEAPQDGLFGHKPAATFTIGKIHSKDSAPQPDIKAVAGQWLHRKDHQKFAEELHSYGTHSGYLANGPLKDTEAVKALHNNDDDAIREHFNKTTGRYQDYNKKPGHLRPAPRHKNKNLETLMDHDPIKMSHEHWTVPDMKDEHKKEMDSFKTKEEFVDAVKNNEVSEGLSRHLRDYKADHENDKEGNPDEKRNWDLKDEKGKWDDSKLGKFWHNPVMSNRKGEYKGLDDDEPMIEQDAVEPKKHTLDRSHLDTPVKKQYKEGDTFEYAGQKHKVLKDHAFHVEAKGDDGHSRELKKTDIENIHHTNKEFEDIHSKKFKDILRGGEKTKEHDLYANAGDPSLEDKEDKSDDAYKASPMHPKVAENLKKVGMDTSEAVKVHNHLMSTEPTKAKQDRSKKGKEATEFSDLTKDPSFSGHYEPSASGSYTPGVDEFDDEDIPTEKLPEKEDYSPEKDLEARREKYEKGKKDYEEIVNKHKHNIINALHPHKNKDYAKDLKEHGEHKISVKDIHPLHTINEAGIKESLKHAKKASAEFTTEDIAKHLGIEHNDYVKGEIENRMKEMGNENKLKVREGKGGEVRASIGKSTQSGNYILKKLRSLLGFDKPKKINPFKE